MPERLNPPISDTGLTLEWSTIPTSLTRILKPSINSCQYAEMLLRSEISSSINYKDKTEFVYFHTDAFSQDSPGSSCVSDVHQAVASAYSNIP